MFKWLKELFASTPGQGMVPINTPKKEYVYMGDGTMEEVIRPTDWVRGPDALPLNSEKLKERLERMRLGERQNRSDLDTSTIVTTAVVASSWAGDSSYSSYDSGSCDSSSGSCD